MSKEISNSENVRNLKKRKILRYFIIVFSIVTIITSVLSLVYGISVLFSFVSFIITSILMRIKDNIPINKQDDLKEVRKMLNKSKK